MTDRDELLMGTRTPVGDWSLYARVSRRPPAGDTLPVVFAHGLMVSSAALRPTLVRLAEDRHVGAPDLPGFGRSDKPPTALPISALAEALGGWLDARGYDRVALVGCSLGTQIVASYAAEHPERVGRVVLQGPVTDPRARSLRKIAMRGQLELPLEIPQLPVMVRDYIRGGPRRFVETLRLALSFPMEAYLPRLTMPTLVLRGEWDPIAPRDYCEDLARQLPDGRVEDVPMTGHAAYHTAPGRMTDALRRFLDEDRVTERRPERDPQHQATAP
jgi:2-hydroxy-6-oxonona-2,4-dienedioate hydrolase